MVTLADSLVSSSARMLPMRMRPDLTAQQQRYQGQVYWVIKEPVGLHYFRFQEEEYAILKMLDGETSLDEIKVEFENNFPPQKITVEELGNFVRHNPHGLAVRCSIAGKKDREHGGFNGEGAICAEILLDARGDPFNCMPLCLGGNNGEQWDQDLIHPS